MTCRYAQEQLAARWTEGLDEAARMELDAHLAACAECRHHADALTELWHGMEQWPEESPGAQSEARFRQMLDAYRLGAQHPDAGEMRDAHRRPAPVRAGGVHPLLPMAALSNRGIRVGVAAMLAACAALVVGLVAGHLYTGRSQDRQRIDALSAELQQMRQMVVLSLLQQSSASERLRGVSYSQEIAPQADDPVATALLDRLNHDPNVNVRLAAVDALKVFAAREGEERARVRSGLRQALGRQNSPLVQISLIDWAVEARDRAPLDALREETDLNPAVRTRLAAALNRLQ